MRQESSIRIRFPFLFVKHLQTAYVLENIVPTSYIYDVLNTLTHVSNVHNSRMQFANQICIRLSLHPSHTHDPLHYYSTIKSVPKHIKPTCKCFLQALLTVTFRNKNAILKQFLSLIRMTSNSLNARIPRVHQSAPKSNSMKDNKIQGRQVYG